eukprot:3669206-Rhodomonas_salina.1
MTRVPRNQRRETASSAQLCIRCMSLIWQCIKAALSGSSTCPLRNVLFPAVDNFLNCHLLASRVFGAQLLLHPWEIGAKLALALRDSCISSSPQAQNQLSPAHARAAIKI